MVDVKHLGRKTRKREMKKRKRNWVVQKKGREREKKWRKKKHAPLQSEGQKMVEKCMEKRGKRKLT